MRVPNQSERGPPRREGTVMLFSVILTVVLMGMTASMVSLSIGDARAVEETESLHKALFLAEAGIEAAKYEINEQVDPDGDGAGTKQTVTALGTYTVVPTQLSATSWRLTSTGVAGLMTRVLAVVINREVTTKFPRAAITIVGDANKNKITFGKSTDLVIAGGDTPAIAFSSEEAADYFGDEFAEAIAAKLIAADNVSGSGLTEYTSGKNTYDLPITFEEEVATQQSQLEELYASLTSKVHDVLLPNATKITKLTGKTTVFGSASQPATINLDAKITLKAGETLSGYGTLFVDDLHIEKGATVDWHGNIVVLGKSSADGTTEDDKTAHIHVEGEGSLLKVEGNLIVLGEGKEDAELKLNKDATVTVDGNLFLGTAFDTTKGERSKLEVGGDSEFTLNGALTLMGAKCELKFKENSTAEITGIVQMAIPEKGKDDKTQIELKGQTSIYKNDDAIRDAMESWSGMGVELDVPETEYIVRSGSLNTLSWSPVAY